MKADTSDLFGWAAVAASFAFALYLLVSPTGRFVETAMEHASRHGPSHATGGLFAAYASDADPRIAVADPAGD